MSNRSSLRFVAGKICVVFKLVNLADIVLNQIQSDLNVFL